MEEIGRARAEHPPLPGQRHGREKGCIGYTDLRIATGHGALGLGNIGPALEQRRGQSGRDVRDGHVERLGRELKIGCIRATQNGERVLGLGAALLHGGELRFGVGQVRLRLRDVDVGGAAGLQADLVDAQRFGAGLHGIGQDLALGIVFAQREILHRDIAVQRQQNDLIIGH